MAVQRKTLRSINPFRIASRKDAPREARGITGFKLDKPDYPDITLAKLSPRGARVVRRDDALDRRTRP